ncbi:putative Cytochrome P450 [Seiridium cardinale]
MATGAHSSLLFATCFLLLPTLYLLYRVHRHPLARYPGPRLAAVTSLVHTFHFLTGDAVAWLDGLHRRYGDVVRIEPDRLSYINSNAWKDIYGHATSTHKANSKDGKNSKNLFSNGSYSISSAHGAEHSRLRKIFSNAFSDRAISKQEPMMLLYVHQMVDLIHREISRTEDSDDGAVLDAVSLFNFATFDIMADLTFGESLGCLQKGGSNPWVDAVQVNLKSMAIKGKLRPYPSLSYIWSLFQANEDKRAVNLHVQNSQNRVTKRLENRDDSKDDIWGLVLKAEGPSALTRIEMNNNANNFMIVGTETSATALSALTFLLLANPDKLDRLNREIRSVDDPDELKDEYLKRMPYLQACLNETLRLYPPVPTGGLRVVGHGGNRILGQIVPAETKLSFATWTAFRTPLYWKDGGMFTPERWLLNEKDYEDHHDYDRREVFQPFGVGPHACIGKK